MAGEKKELIRCGVLQTKEMMAMSDFRESAYWVERAEYDL